MTKAKFSGKSIASASGYWGSPYRTAQALQVSERVRVAHQDQLLMRGRCVDLWTPVKATTPGAIACTCTKALTESADRSCLSCFGTKYAPGYLKFLHRTQFWCSAEHASFTLTNAAITTGKKSNVIGLTGSALSGEVLTQYKTLDTPTAATYEIKLEAYRRTPTAQIQLYYSVAETAGSPLWNLLTLTEVTDGFGFTATIPGESLEEVPQIRFRITLARAAATDKTPQFEILKLRHLATENINKAITRRRPDYTPGSILVLRPWTQEQNLLEAARGLVQEHAGSASWTAPLDYFDTSLTINTPNCRIDDNGGPHAFYEYTSGVQQTDRYAITNVSYSEQFINQFTHQAFAERRLQDGEPLLRVW